jgi:hypothetical protein
MGYMECMGEGGMYWATYDQCLVGASNKVYGVGHIIVDISPNDKE